jgi:hypothetical protein
MMKHINQYTMPASSVKFFGGEPPFEDCFFCQRFDEGLNACRRLTSRCNREREDNKEDKKDE